MYCPTCKDEFRAGFTRCATCNVDLVEDLSAAEVTAEKPEAATAPAPVQMAEYCGFLGLDEARQARDELRRAHIRADIVIREAPGSNLDAAPDEEYWLRVDVSKYAKAPDVLGYHPGEGESDDPAGDTAGLTGGFGPKVIAPAKPQEMDHPATGEHFQCSDCGHDVAIEEPFCPNCGVRFEDD